MLQKRQEGLGGEHGSPGGSQFERQGQSIQAMANFSDGTGISGRDLKIVLDGLYPLQEQGSRRSALDRLRVRVGEIRQGEGEDRKLVFSRRCNTSRLVTTIF